MDRSERYYKISKILNLGKPVNTKRLLEIIDPCSRATLLRDIEYLKIGTSLPVRRKLIPKLNLFTRTIAITPYSLHTQGRTVIPIKLFDVCCRALHEDTGFLFRIEESNPGLADWLLA